MSLFLSVSFLKRRLYSDEEARPLEIVLIIADDDGHEMKCMINAKSDLDNFRSIVA